MFKGRNGSACASRVAALLLGLLFVISNTAPLRAQSSRGTVAGLISDASGAAMGSVNVELTEKKTGVARSTTSNDAGIYRFDAVDPGDYQVQVKAPGFKVAASSFQVAAGQTASVDIQLQIGEASTVVDVTTDAVQLQTEAPVRGGTIATQQIIDLPIASRNPVGLALTLPGVSTNRYGFGSSTFSVNGTRGRSNNFMIDGTENNDISVAGQAFQITNPDSVQEVSVQTSNYDAEYGRAGGAVVNVITRSGTNSYHGTLTYFLDVTNDDATTNLQALSAEVQARGKPLPGTDAWYSGTFGGPIKKNRTFFFGSYLEERLHSVGQFNLKTLSPSGRAALRSLFPQGTNKNADLLLSISAGQDANSQFFTQSAGPGRPDIQFGTYSRPYANAVRDRQLMGKIDHQFSEKDQLSGRYLFDDTIQPAGGNVTYIGLDTPYNGRNQNVVVTETHVFSPSLTNEFRLPYNRIVVGYPATGINSVAQNIPYITIQGGPTQLGLSSTFPQGRIANNYGLQDTVSYIRGKHSFRFGLDLLDQRSKQAAPFNGRGAVTYNASNGYTGLANFLDDFGGSAGSASRDFGTPSYYPNLFRQAYFGQDRWRATEALTLTLGLRYEYFGVPINSIPTPAYTGLFNVNPVTFDGPYNKPNKVQPDKNNFGPTVGLAYAPSGSGPLGWLFGQKKTVFRLGYQIGYDSFFNNIASNAFASSPNLVATSVSSTPTTANPRGLGNFSTAFPQTPRALLPTDSQTLVLSNLVNPYYQKWSVGVQREFFGMVADVSYVGSKGTKLFINEDLNPLVPASLRINPNNVTSINGNPLQARLDPLQGSRLIRTNGGSSIYHALQSSLNRRFSNGLGFNLAYTWSKLIDNASEIFGTTGNGSPQNTAVPSIYGGLAIDRSVSLFDRPHRVSLTYLYQLPFRKDQSNLLGHIVGGWEISGVTTFESGAPINITNGVDADGLGSNFDRPDYNPLGQKNVRAVPNTGSPTGYINPDTNTPIDPKTAEYIALPAFTGTTPGRTGNLGRFTERTPWINNFNVNLLKTTRITEGIRLEFRTEFFNIFNHPQYGNLSASPFDNGTLTIPGNVTSTGAGQFLNPGLADGGSRVIRYQLKLVF